MDTKTERLIDKGSLLLPEAVSTVAAEADLIFNVITYGSVIFFILIVIALAYLALKYKRSATNNTPIKHVIHNNKLEIIWSVIPTLICIGIFYYGFKVYLHLIIPPENAQEINVVAKKWLWEVEYPETGLKLLNEIVVPVNTPIKLMMYSEDVLHSLFIPNFRIKKDIVPNRYTRVWFEATRPGYFQLFCTEFCGDGHSNMLATVKVLSQKDYEIWLKEGDDAATKGMTLDELGKKLYVSKACNSCHTVDGKASVGSTWKGLYGAQRDLTNGESVTADKNYLRESIVAPAAKVVKGYQPIMPAFQGLLSDREIDALISYIKTIK